MLIILHFKYHLTCNGAFFEFISRKGSRIVAVDSDAQGGSLGEVELVAKHGNRVLEGHFHRDGTTGKIDLDVP